MPKTAKRQSGFSLLELVVALLILSVVMAAVLAQVTRIQARSAGEQSKLDVFQDTREFMNQMVRDLHQAGYPNIRIYAAGALPTTPVVNDPANAVGLVRVDADQLWFEGDVDGTGVSSIQYSIATTGTNCPCLSRSQTAKLAGNPLTGQGTAAFQTELQKVRSGTTSNPMFYAYRADGSEVSLPVDFNSNPGDIADIRTIRVVMTVESTKYDLERKMFPQTTLNALIRLNNCSQAAIGRAMSCR
jgi:prepilin-type N-terminal cleavage/methylation domain-containing protein